MGEVNFMAEHNTFLLPVEAHSKSRFISEFWLPLYAY